jgi:FMN-dependent NADH-azoreductase
MSYLLHVTVSPGGDNSYSRKLGQTFLQAFKAEHSSVEVKTRDLNANPLPHLDGEALFAGYTPADQRTPSAAAKHQTRLDLIDEISKASAIVIESPMWNWNVPSALKAYLDQIILPGVFDTSSKSLAGKSVTLLIACGGAYGEGSWHPEWDYLSGYLQVIFKNLGATDIELIRTEYTLAGVVPGMEGLVGKKEESFEAATAAAGRRGQSAVLA